MEKVGAPVGGRVHWLLWHLSSEFKRAHKLSFDYEYHNYHFIRYEDANWRKLPIDEYIIVRTSRRCFRCMYFNYNTNYFEYFSEKTSYAMAGHLLHLFRKIKTSEQKREDT